MTNIDIVKLSKSKIMTYDTCPRLFKEIYVDGTIESEDSTESIDGKLFHEWAYLFFKHCENIPFDKWEDAFVPKNISSKIKSMMEFFISTERNRLAVCNYDFKKWMPKYLEYEIVNDKYHTIIDRIDSWNSKSYVLIEYKTGSSMDIRRLSKELHIYKYILDDTSSGIKIKNMMVYNPRLQLIKPIKYNHRIYKSIDRAINEIFKSLDSNNFKEKKSGFCMYCPIKPFCR